MDRTILFRHQEVVRLPDDTFGVALGNLFEDHVYSDHKKCVVLLFNEFKTSTHDNGLREVDPNQLHKQYE